MQLFQQRVFGNMVFLGQVTVVGKTVVDDEGVGFESHHAVRIDMEIVRHEDIVGGLVETVHAFAHEAALLPPVEKDHGGDDDRAERKQRQLQVRHAIEFL